VTARRSARVVAAAILLAALPAIAQAHLVVTGMGPIYDGIDHFGLSPEDSIPVVALAFFAGLRGPATARLLLAALPLAWLAGGLIALSGAAAPAIALSIATAAAFLAIGGLLAGNPELPRAASVSAAVALGLMRGFADLSGTAFSGGHLLTLAGMSASVFVVFALAASLTLPLQRFWMIVAVRVGGSWLAALGLLLAGWVWRYGARAF
jgi:urease accessory protein